MKMSNLIATGLAILVVAACSQSMTDAAKSPDNRPGAAVVQQQAQPEIDRGGMGGDGGGGY